MSIKVLVTGSSGQLGLTLKDLFGTNKHGIQFYFLSKAQLDITSETDIKKIFEAEAFNYCINCAAFTNVEDAEKEPDQAFGINALGAKNLAEICKAHGTTLVHISTDYVFDGSKTKGYTESDTPNPINQYGVSKLKGEEAIESLMTEYFIIRTSWLYSTYNANFFLSIIKKIDQKEKIVVTTKQLGSPTSTKELARFIYFLIAVDIKAYGIYNFSSQGSTTWHKFAEQIGHLYGKKNSPEIWPTANFPTLAKRPENSTFDLSKTMAIYKDIKGWKEALKEIIEEYKSKENI